MWDFICLCRWLMFLWILCVLSMLVLCSVGMNRLLLVFIVMFIFMCVCNVWVRVLLLN